MFRIGLIPTGTRWCALEGERRRVGAGKREKESERARETSEMEADGTYAPPYHPPTTPNWVMLDITVIIITSQLSYFALAFFFLFFSFFYSTLFFRLPLLFSRFFLLFFPFLIFFFYPSFAFQRCFCFVFSRYGASHTNPCLPAATASVATTTAAAPDTGLPANERVAEARRGAAERCTVKLQTTIWFDYAPRF